MHSHLARRIFLGLILIGIGVIFLAGQAGWIEVDPGYIASNFWPVILIAIGLSGLVGGRSQGGSVIWSLFMIFLGAGFLLRNLNIVDMDMGDYFKLLIPVLIILFGLRMMFRPAGRERNRDQRDFAYKYEYKYDYNFNADNAQVPPPPGGMAPPPPPPPPLGGIPAPEPQQRHSGENRSGFIGDLYLGHDAWELKPMNVSHFIGDTIIDLTKAQIPYGETRLNVSAFIGDVKVFVPNDIDVEIHVESSSFLGDITVFNRREGGFLRSMKEETPGYPLADKKIRLQCNLFIGDIHVQKVG